MEKDVVRRFTVERSGNNVSVTFVPKKSMVAPAGTPGWSMFGCTESPRAHGASGCGKFAFRIGATSVPARLVPADTKLRDVNSAIPFPLTTSAGTEVLKKDRGVLSWRALWE